MESNNKMKKIVYILLAIFILGSINTVFAQDEAFFKIYLANSKYNGEIVLPEGYRKEEGMIFNNIWWYPIFFKTPYVTLMWNH